MPNLGNTPSDPAFAAKTGRAGLDLLEQIANARPIAPRAERFLFVRHGETEGNFQRILQHPDISLNETGFAQARQVGQLLAGCGAQRIVASTVRRAWQTAEIVAEALGIAALPDERLRERFFGDLIGTSSRDLNWAADPPNGETLEQFLDRAQAGLLGALDTAVPTLLIAHGGTLYALAYSLRLKLEEGMVKNATPLLFERVDERWTMRRVAPEGALQRHANIGW